MNVTPIFKQIDLNHPHLKEIITASIGNPTADKISTVLASYAKDGKLIGAFISNQLIGCVGYTVNAGHLVIRHLSVAKGFQNKKIATNLMRYILAFEDCHELSASTDIEAKGFYEKLLFQCIKTDSKFDTDNFAASLSANFCIASRSWYLPMILPSRSSWIMRLSLSITLLSA